MKSLARKAEELDRIRVQRNRLGHALVCLAGFIASHFHNGIPEGKESYWVKHALQVADRILNPADMPAIAKELDRIRVQRNRLGHALVCLAEFIASHCRKDIPAGKTSHWMKDALKVGKAICDDKAGDAGL
jgi:hypothetical protein